MSDLGPGWVNQPVELAGCSSTISGFNSLLSSGVRNMTGIWAPCHRILVVFQSHLAAPVSPEKISSYEQIFYSPHPVSVVELLRFIFVCCQLGLSAWKYDIYRTDKLSLEISVRISNRFSLLRKCKWSEYRAPCRYNYIATYLVGLRAIKTMSKHFYIKDFYTVIVVVVLSDTFTVWSFYNTETWPGDNWPVKLHIETWWNIE